MAEDIYMPDWPSRNPPPTLDEWLRASPEQHAAWDRARELRQGRISAVAMRRQQRAEQRAQQAASAERIPKLFKLCHDVCDWLRAEGAPGRASGLEERLNTLEAT